VALRADNNLEDFPGYNYPPRGRYTKVSFFRGRMIVTSGRFPSRSIAVSYRARLGKHRTRSGTASGVFSLLFLQLVTYSMDQSSNGGSLATEGPSSMSQRLAAGHYSGRSRTGRVTGFRIAAVGSYVPERVVTNESLVALGCDSEWIRQRTGILERRQAADDQATSDLAYLAAQDCLRRGGVAAEEVDLIVVATMTPDYFTPSVGCLLQHQLGCQAPAMDINAACSGFLYALVTAGQFVASGGAKRALVVGAEVMTRFVDARDRKTYPLFGDGAGAVLLVPDAQPDSGLSGYCLGSEGVGGPMLCIPGGGSRQRLNSEAIDRGDQFLKMDGPSVFKWAVRVVRDSALDCLLAAERTPQELDLVILHQANQRIIDSAVSDLGVSGDRVFVNLDRFGNTSAASIPLALDDALRQGRLVAGHRIMLCGFGAGLTWGGAVINWR
jgi:3-oxoacyl-[acyl-carrier-protein] synthase-3